MGIQDRDYMAERHSRTFDVRMERERPFGPPTEKSSFLRIVAFWIILGFALYQGFGWWQKKQLAARAEWTHAAAALNRSQPAAPAPQERRGAYSTPAQAPQIRDQVLSPAPARGVQPTAPQPLSFQHKPPETGGTIYLCKAYNGGTFWAQAHCSQHQALIESIVSVPRGMPFEQQVQIGQEQRRQAAVQMAATTAPPVSAAPAVSTKAECQALDARVQHLDALARQPQGPQMQDWLREQRRAARDRQFALRC